MLHCLYNHSRTQFITDLQLRLLYSDLIKSLESNAFLKALRAPALSRGRARCQIWPFHPQMRNIWTTKSDPAGCHVLPHQTYRIDGILRAMPSDYRTARTVGIKIPLR